MSKQHESDRRSPHEGPRAALRSIARRAMRARGLSPEFSRAALAQTDGTNHAATTSPADGVAARNLRGLLWASIDNDDSRDLDQLSAAEDLGSGQVRIYVAVADVDALVGKGSPVDEHAETNTTSVYTAAEIFPMLPEKFSTDLTSLNQSEERLAVVVEMVVAGDGSVKDSGVYRGLVLNRAKLAYDAVAAWLDGKTAEPPRVSAVPGLAAALRLQDRVAQSMKGRRHEHGALNLESIEPRAIWDGDALADMRQDAKNRARELIEELMVAANGVTARFLDKQGFPSLRRVLKSPERWSRLVELAAEQGEKLPGAPDARALEAFLMRQREARPDTFPDLSLSVVKLLGRGEYDVEYPGKRAEGHFGLAVRDYTHSTAPNRRFPDLIAQRLIKAALAGNRPPYDERELAALARHCTDQEDNAAKVERQVRKSAAALLLSSRVGERFSGIVTGASSKGTWVRIEHPAVEGRIVHGFDGTDVGDHVRVELVHTDVERGFIDFVRAG
ncbi:MAG TPA: RNB domain-containing ribonuclease [Polyangiaceae bacterium]|jgi:exoribonuclease-2|nr:RNB domain-containing ribonuclease [Polyangiaceae bacterium]